MQWRSKIVREERPCEEDPEGNYDFMVCVKNSQAEWHPFHSHQKSPFNIVTIKKSRVTGTCDSHHIMLTILINIVTIKKSRMIVTWQAPYYGHHKIINIVTIKKSRMIVTMWQAREIGCRPGWEDWSDKSWPACTQVYYWLHEVIKK